MVSGPPPGKNLSAFDELAAPNLAYGGHPHGQRYGQQQHFGHHSHQTQQHMGGGFYQQPHQSMAFQQQQPTAHMMGTNSAANISAFMDPHAHQTSYNSGSGNGYARPAQSGGRDPFAGLGLPQH